MASAASCAPEPAPARPSFAKVAAPTYKADLPQENRHVSRPPVAVPQIALHASHARRNLLSNGTTSEHSPQTRSTGITSKPTVREDQWASASGSQAAVQSEGNDNIVEKPPAPTSNTKILPAEENLTQLSVSDSSMKPPSLDGKSVASGTTLALDEKESIRPDDSASLRAVEEEDLTPPESNAAGSRVGSDSEARAFRAQLHEIAVMNPQTQHDVVPGRFSNTIVNSSHTVFGPHSVPNAASEAIPQPLVVSPEPPDGTLPLAALPDEKLIEALQSPRDRLFVVKIEQDFIDFIKDSRENEYCLPNCNTFYRMLAHRLADYYMLGHVVDNAMTGVRITRTPYCRIPPPLSQMVDVMKSADTPPVDLPARKIMRRGDDARSGTTTTSTSGVPSKTTSEVGASDISIEKTKDRSALTREEREARYKEARQRIFGKTGAEEVDSTEAVSLIDEKNASRSSSTSGKKRSKKQRSTEDDGFEARSRYNAYYPQPYPAAAYPGDATTYYNGLTSPQPYSPMQHNTSPMPGYGNFYPTISSNGPQGPYVWSGAQYPTHSTPPMYSAYGQIPGSYDLSADFQRGMQSYQTAAMHTQMTPKMTNAAMAGYSEPYSSSPPSITGSSNWSPVAQAPAFSIVPSSPSYPIQNNVSMPAHSHSVSSVSYPFGQFPATVSGKSHRNQHPIPGSYQRQQFNPQIQAFVPGGRNGAVHAQSSIVSGQMPGSSGHGGSYLPLGSMTAHRQSPSSATSGTPATPLLSQNSIPMTSVSNTSPAPSIPSSGSKQIPSVPAQSSIAKYGIPSSLPARPPATQQQVTKLALPGNAPGASRSSGSAA